MEVDNMGFVLLIPLHLKRSSPSASENVRRASDFDLFSHLVRLHLFKCLPLSQLHGMTAKNPGLKAFCAEISAKLNSAPVVVNCLHPPSFHDDPRTLKTLGGTTRPKSRLKRVSASCPNQSRANHK
jgi:hypothetical protein